MLALDGNFDNALETVIKSGLATPSVGTHKLCVRVKDAAGNWGPNFTTVISIENVLVPRDVKITQAELYWDTDPGQGNGTVMLALDGNFDNALESAINNSVTTPSLGTHKLCVRVKDISGNWSPVFTKIVSIENQFVPRDIKITQAELFFDTDPGQGNGTAMLALDGNFNDALESAVKNVNTTFIAPGIHALSTRVKDVAGNWGPLYTVAMYIDSCITTPHPTVTVNGSSTICVGDSVKLTANAGYNTYTWISGITPIGNGNTIYIKNSGVYKVTVTDGNGCPGTSAAVIISTYSATINTNGSTAFCQGDSLTLIASAASSYTWSTGVHSQSIIIHTAGNYTVMETNANGCVATSVITASVNASPITPTITVSGQDLVSSASVGNQWYLNGNLITGATANIYTPTQNGVYTVVVSNSNNCSSTSSVHTVNNIGIEQFIEANLQIYPNPFSETTTVSLSGDISKLSVSICDGLGREVKRMDVEKHVFTIDANELDNGVYFIRFMKEQKLVSIHKIIVNK